jgi:hypothetical protein
MGFLVTAFMIGGGLAGFLAMAFTLRRVNKDFKHWFDKYMWGVEE